jgi:hypothetical protein
MVDLDESRVVHGVGDEASILPSRLRRCLKVALQLVTSTTQPWDASRNVLISEAFVRMFVEVCGHYRNHIVTQQDSMKVFEVRSRRVTSEGSDLNWDWWIVPMWKVSWNWGNSKVTVIWEVMPCNVVVDWRHLVGTWLSPSRIIHWRCSHMFLQNVGNYLPDYVSLHP